MSMTVLAIDKELSTRLANIGLLCSFLVVGIHVAHPSQSGTLTWYMNQFFRVGICTIAVPCFFVISGFLLAGHFDEHSWWKKEVSKRLRSLVVPFVIWGLLYLGFASSLSLFADYRAGRPVGTHNCFANWAWVSGLGLNPFRQPGLGPLWFVRSLFLLVVASPLFVWLLRRRMIPVLLFCLVPFYCVVVPADIVGNQFWVSEAWHRAFRFGLFSLEGVVYFLVGIWLRFNPVSLTRRTALFCGGIGLFLLLFRIGLLAAGYECSVVLVSLHIPFVLLFVWRCMPSRPLSKVLQGLAFPVFLLHMFPNQIWMSFFRTSGDCWWMVGGQWILIFGILSLLAMLLKKRFPRFSTMAFGGR